MSSILFGLTLISASLQTAWALFAEGQMYALPVIAVLLYVGWGSVRSGSGYLHSRLGSDGLL